MFTIAGALSRQAKNEADYDGNGEDEKEYFFHIASRAITKFYNELSYYRDYILKNYPHQVWKKGQWYLLVRAILMFFVIILPSLNSQESMTYEEAVSKWARGKFVPDSDT